MKLLLIAALVLPASAWSARIKDLATLRGTRDNQLLGYGLVIGLSGTGDKASELTENSLNLALKGMGVDLKSAKIETKNVAAVVVSATLPPFSKVGGRVDVTVSSVGSATSLDGGTLLATALRAPDGNVYAMAQGKIVTSKRSEGSTKVGGQTLVTAQVPNGALLEKEVTYDLSSTKELRYQLLHPDFTTAARMARRINEELGGKYATASDAASIEIIPPYTYEGTMVELVAQLESVDVEADRKAKVVINQRTGTVVLGEHVQIAPVAIAHNNLKIEIREPAAVANDGNTSEAAPAGKAKQVMVVKPAPNVADVAASLNEMGASADDLVTLLNSLKAAGALLAEVEVQ